MDVRLLPLALAILLSASGSSSAELKMMLSGCWVNDLNSTMLINVTNSGLISGLYVSHVSTSGATVKGIITGYQHVRGVSTFGIVVKWTTGSITVWAGQYFQTNEHEILNTMWLLRLSAPNPAENWKATWTGTDVFHRDSEACVNIHSDSIAQGSGSGASSDNSDPY
ncbi:avidin-like [Stegostoma tigrinum]|uniref:avidin-like n=1 Tax=Stegostoma tigrinum TaxID=3053191 RepID=UPI00202B17A1|nr:avidin-like [Stegostoma tigrinum]